MLGSVAVHRTGEITLNEMEQITIWSKYFAGSGIRTSDQRFKINDVAISALWPTGHASSNALNNSARLCTPSFA
jgi:hypothetical protein